ncbi:MAG: DUF427 domain-containing protein [Deltaproteobacteria bacterium]
MKPRALKLLPGQESVWDYPRPPRLERCARHIRVIFAGITIADTKSSARVLETSHPPVYYIPPSDIRMEFLSLEEGRRSFCEWKGVASYYSIAALGKTARLAAWFYPQPPPKFAALSGCVAFYPQFMDACYVDGELASAQPGGFYGGWITANIAGPFKGEPGSEGW